MDKISNNKKKYDTVTLKNNGKLFPLWVLQNFKKYKLPEILRKENEDPCNIEIKKELRKYQEFIGEFLAPGSLYNEILLYHGLGSGKTATSINLMNIMYNYNSESNFIILIKASLRDDPWMKDLKQWLGRDPDEDMNTDVTNLDRFKSIHFIHYDSPFADKHFLDTMKKIDTTKPTLYIIDEVHNFIRNVYSNYKLKTGKRAQVIYEYILRDKKENSDIKIILISATPGINEPFELSLMFNLLRPGIFPTSELEFNQIFITNLHYPILNPLRKNLFQRRILGLVSYYVGANPLFYAKERLTYVDLPMSDHQYRIYHEFEKKEAEIEKKAKYRHSKLYRTYTRQACNFVFPDINSEITGESRPRPYKYKLDEKTVDLVDKGINVDVKNSNDREQLNKYLNALNSFIIGTEKYFQHLNEEDKKKGRIIQDDLHDFKINYENIYKSKFINFYTSETQKSNVFTKMYECSPKMTAIVFMSYMSPGKVMVYTNYVLMEGIDILKIYYKICGFNSYDKSRDFLGFCEYHGRIDKQERIKIKRMFNNNDNINGNKCKIILLSPSATEGIELSNIRQEHILEPYWNEVRIQQVIGRGIRQCSHKDLPLNDRIVDTYRYKVIKPSPRYPDDINSITTDEYIEDQAKAKANLIESFLSAMKEAAVDCKLFEKHNKVNQSYHCFNFPEKNLMDKNIGPAYKEEIKDDLQYDSGLNAINSRIERIKVIKIQAVHPILSSTSQDIEQKYSAPNIYWYHNSSGMVYDYELHYPVGKVELIGGLPNKLDKNIYIMSILIDIPLLVKKT